MANPFVHVELSTDHPAAAKKFYRKLFGWKLRDVRMGPGQTYTLIEVGKGTGGGIQKKPVPGAPATWLAYVLVDDVKKTMARARRAGAQVHVEYMEVPGYGALGVFGDPAGATLAVWQPFRKPRSRARK